MVTEAALREGITCGEFVREAIVQRARMTSRLVRVRDQRRRHRKKAADEKELSMSKNTVTVEARCPAQIRMAADDLLKHLNGPIPLVIVDADGERQVGIARLEMRDGELKLASGTFPTRSLVIVAEMDPADRDQLGLGSNPDKVDLCWEFVLPRIAPTAVRIRADSDMKSFDKATTSRLLWAGSDELG